MAEDELKCCSLITEYTADMIRHVRNNLLGFGCFEDIINSLNREKNRLDELDVRFYRLRSALDDIVRRYEETENANCMFLMIAGQIASILPGQFFLLRAQNCSDIVVD